MTFNLSHITKFLKKLMSKEPERLKKGKEFHKQVQNTWPRGDEGDIIPEKTITKPSGRKGRIDVFVDNAGDGDLVAVVEIKDSDWDAMTPKAVRRNVGRHSNQIYDYIDSQLDEGKTVSPGIIFPKLPKDPARLNLDREHVFEREHEGAVHTMEFEVLVGSIIALPSENQEKIKNTIVKIDSHNGDVMHYLNYVAEGFIRYKVEA